MNTARIIKPKFLLVSLLAPLAVLPVARAAAPVKPNLLILLTDDQRWDAMGCASNRIVQTPEMDRLAREGTWFVHAFATSSICAASRASIFTGQYERTHRCNFHTGTLRRTQLEQSYPMLLRRAGYYTGFIGKYGVGDGPREIEGSEVFDRWHGFYGQGQYLPKTHPGQHLNAVMVEQARDFLDRAPAGKPWCLSISFKSPHSGQGYLGYEVEPDLRGLYADVTTPAPPTAKQEYFEALPEFLRRCNARTSYWQQRFSTPQQYQAVMKDYYRLITGADRAIGRIRAELARRGMAENTVILFLSDNGDMMGDYMLGGKELLYDVSLRVPLIVLDPRAAPSARGQRRVELALNIDIAPTVLDLAGAPVPAAMQGRSLAPLVRGERAAWRQDFFCENNFRVPAQYYPMIEGIRTTRWKYIRYADVQPVTEQLFDLEKDANEVHDLARVPEHVSTLADLRRRCEELRAEASPGRPNIVFFLADDLGYGDLGCHGNPHVKTPQLDAFAREAVALTNFHVSPVCSPTRASLMTGRYHFRTGVCDVFGRGCQMDPAEVTLAEALRCAGYATGIFGKWHLGDDAQRGPNAQGFDEALVHTGPALGKYFDPELVHNGQRKKFTGYCMDIFTEHALEFMRHNRTRPFFLYLPANLIHVPLQVSDELAAPFAALGLGPPTAKAYGMLRSVDDSFGRVRAALKELGLEDNTLLIFASDNGPCSSSVPTDRFMAGLHGLKGTVYENGIRVPCFARWPAGFRSPAQVTRLTAHLDVMPTVLDACGVAAPAGGRLDGASLLPLLRNPAADWPQRTLFFQWDSGQQPRRGHAFCVLTEKWKLVQPCGMDSPQQQHIRDRYAQLGRLQGRGERSIDGPPRYELYDLSSDPGETRDLAGAQPAVVETMKKQYETWFGDVCKRWLVAPAHAAGVTPSRPNIVFIMADDLGWRDLGCFGSQFHQTPNLDRLAARGVKFTQAYAANPLCSPTRSSVLTGLWPARTGITAPACHLPQVVLEKQLVKGNPNMPVLVANSVTRLKTDYVTLPKVLRDAGYRTGHFGKWHLGAEPYSALQHGFDVDWPHWPGPGPAGSYVAPWKFPVALKIESKPGEHIEDTVSARVVQFIRENRDRPFYVNYWPFSVHAPYDAKDELVAKYRQRADPGNPQRNPVYGAMVESLDDGVGRVLAALEECGLTDRTIVVFFSDNGGISWGGPGDTVEQKSARFQADMTASPTSNLPLRNGKASLYEGGVREPCIVVWPGVTKPGTVNDTVIQSIDWMPTLLDMAGVPRPENAKPDGVSLVPVLKGGTLPRNTIFCHFPHDTPASGQHPGTSVRRGDWKLIRLYARNDDGTDQFELYNLRDDVGETKNRAAEEPERVRELNALITKFLTDTEAVVPVRNPGYKPGAAGKSTGRAKRRGS